MDYVQIPLKTISLRASVCGDGRDFHPFPPPKDPRPTPKEVPSQQEIDGRISFPLNPIIFWKWFWEILYKMSEPGSYGHCSSIFLWSCLKCLFVQWIIFSAVSVNTKITHLVLHILPFSIFTVIKGIFCYFFCLMPFLFRCLHCRAFSQCCAVFVASCGPLTTARLDCCQPPRIFTSVRNVWLVVPWTIEHML